MDTNTRANATGLVGADSIVDTLLDRSKLLELTEGIAVLRGHKRGNQEMHQ